VNQLLDQQEDEIYDFHKHLDQCEQCREHPFNLCPIGNKLLLASAEGKVDG